MLLLVLGASSSSNAMKILTIKNNQALIDVEDESLQNNDKLVARNSEGKTKAILEVKKIQGKRAIAHLLKGQIEADYVLAKHVPKSQTSSQGSKWGVVAGIANNTMTVKPNSLTSVTLSGSSTVLSAFYQREISGGFSTRILTGYHTLQASGTSSTITACASSGCKVDISYLGLEALARYSFMKDSSKDIWGGAGLGFLFALGKSSNVLDTSKITTNQTILLSLGYDWKLSKSSFIPVQFDYALYPDNATSSAKQMILRLGYGTDF